MKHFTKLLSEVIMEINYYQYVLECIRSRIWTKFLNIVSYKLALLFIKPVSEVKTSNSSYYNNDLANDPIFKKSKMEIMRIICKYYMSIISNQKEYISEIENHSTVRILSEEIAIDDVSIVRNNTINKSSEYFTESIFFQTFQTLHNTQYGKEAKEFLFADFKYNDFPIVEYEKAFSIIINANNSFYEYFKKLLSIVEKQKDSIEGKVVIYENKNSNDFDSQIVKFTIELNKGLDELTEDPEFKNRDYELRDCKKKHFSIWEGSFDNMHKRFFTEYTKKYLYDDQNYNENLYILIARVLIRYSFFGKDKEGIFLSLKPELYHDFHKELCFDNKFNIIEGFASPINVNSVIYHSLFPDVDKYFCSKNSFNVSIKENLIDSNKTTDIFILNPPYTLWAIKKMSQSVDEYLQRKESVFIVCLPDWRNESKVPYSGYEILKNNRYLKSFDIVNNYNFFDFLNGLYRPINVPSLFFVLSSCDNRTTNRITKVLREHLMNSNEEI